MPPEDGWGDDPSSEQPTTRRSSIGNFPGAGFPTHGARLLLDGTGTMFRVYAPERKQIELVLYDAHGSAETRRVRMAKQPDGFHALTVRGVVVGALYRFAVDGAPPVADPASRCQPFGIDGPSRVENPNLLTWTDQDFRGCPLEDLVLYELHVGTATTEGTFRALTEILPRIRALGATAVELMPIVESAGSRNWGYDGVFPFAPYHAYGSPTDFAAFVDAAHRADLAVILDVVYNHVGPHGSTHGRVTGKHFHPTTRTPWGPALGIDDEHVRAFVLENATHWIRDFHVDGLRLDAARFVGVEPIAGGPSMVTAIAEVARAAASEREVLVIAEDDGNDARITRETSRGGLGLDAVWSDDLHHVLRRMLTDERGGVLGDYQGTIAELVRVLRNGWLYEGQVAPSTGAARGTPAFDIPPSRIVQYLQNHDLVGNRPAADRWVMQGPLLRAVTTLFLSTPYTPLLFMGQEHAAPSPFPYFVDLPKDLVGAVRDGRLRDIAAFAGEFDPKIVPDLAAPATLGAATLDWSHADRTPGREVLALHQALLALRRSEPAMSANRRADFDVVAVGDRAVAVLRRARGSFSNLLFVVSLGRELTLKLGDRAETAPGEGRRWNLLLDTEEARFGGTTPATLDGRALALPGPGAVVLRSGRRES